MEFDCENKTPEIYPKGCHENCSLSLRRRCSLYRIYMRDGVPVKFEEVVNATVRKSLAEIGEC